MNGRCWILIFHMLDLVDAVLAVFRLTLTLCFGFALTLLLGTLLLGEPLLLFLLHPLTFGFFALSLGLCFASTTFLPLLVQRAGLQFAIEAVQKFLHGLRAIRRVLLQAQGHQFRQGSGDVARKSLARPRGILLLSPPGCGKSQFAKSLGNEVGRPTLVLDVGSLMGSLVGETESRTRQALRIIDAMAPCVCFIDELEKALSGVASSGQTDSGVSARLFGTFLTYLSDHTSDVFVVATSNDISKLPPEIGRAERFDGIFFIDLPSSAERERIWPIHLNKYGLNIDEKRPDDRDWTGAEIGRRGGATGPTQ